MTDFEAIIQLLARYNIRYIIVGGMAATVHGSARLTLDLDIVYERPEDNLTKLVAALAQVNPYLRGAPPGLPFEWSVETLKMGLNFTLTTDLGPIDLLGEIVGGGKYGDLMKTSLEISLFGETCDCIGLEQLIKAKRAAGEPKDLESLAELEGLLEQRSKDTKS